jgi:hypothetical protein
MIGYSQYPEDMLDSMASLVRHVHDDEKRYSDDNILSSIVTIMKDYDFENDYWNSQEIVRIVRDMDGSVPRKWSDDSRSYDIAKQVLDLLIYNDSSYIIDQETVAYYTVSYNIPDSQYPYVRYVGSVLQDTVSSGFVLPDTIIVVMQKEDGSLVYPVIRDEST